MSKILLAIASTMIGPLAALVTTRLMDYVDDVLKWTTNLPDGVKQILVMALAALIPAANAQWGLALPSDPANLLSQPTVQGIVATLLAFVLKGHAKAAAALPAPTPAATGQIGKVS